MADLLDVTEAEAAELEGLVAVEPGSDLHGKLMLARALKEKRDTATAEYDAIKEELGKLLEADGKQGFTLGGKPVVRRSIVRANRLDSKGLKAKHPKIYAAFASITESVRVTVT